MGSGDFDFIIRPYFGNKENEIAPFPQEVPAKRTSQQDTLLNQLARRVGDDTRRQRSMRTFNYFVMSGLMLVASIAHAECDSCGGNASGVGGYSTGFHPYGGGFGGYSAGWGGYTNCGHGNCGYANSLWDGFCSEDCGCGGGVCAPKCGGLFSRCGCGGRTFGGGWFGLGAGSQRCGGGGCGDCGDMCGMGTCGMGTCGMGTFGTGLTCGCRGRFGWRNKLTYSLEDSCCPVATDGCCGGGYSGTNWSDASTWGAPAAAESAVEPEPLPAAKPVEESGNWQAPSDWDVTETESFNAPLEAPTSQKGPFYNVPQQNGRGGSQPAQDRQTDEVPGGAEIDEFLNDA